MTQTERNFHTLIANQWENNRFLCVGIDPVNEKLPASIQVIENPQERLVVWGKSLIDATRDTVAAYKPNTAFFEGYGSAGIAALEELCAYMREAAPDVAIILDAKRGDIESTNEGTATFAFDVCGADAITVQPYVGGSALEPFLRRTEKGVIVLCRTSNESAPEFQNAVLQGTSSALYDFVASTATNTWNNTYQQDCWLVVGATAPEECAAIRVAYPRAPFLIPGIGAQGGDLEKTLTAAKRADGKGFLISASRAVIYASAGDDFAQAAATAAQDYHNQITTLLNA